MPAAPSPDSSGQVPIPAPVIPDYELVRRIGRGSYGDVWIALGLTGIYRAVKIVWRERFPDPEPFEREFKGLKEFAAVSLTETRQLALLHVGRNDAAGFFYYIMELADDAEHGRSIDPQTYVPFTLREMRARRGRISPDEAIAIAIELTRGLIGLHQRGLVHRDIKPSNVIMVAGAPKLADIGLVTVASEARTYVGTEGFVPPEGPGSAAADIYGLGKLIYELSSGLDRHDYPRLPPNLNEWPDRKGLLELNEVLFRACDSDPSRRYASAQALLDDLFLLQAGRSLRRLRNVERMFKRAYQVAAVLALIAGLGLAGAFVERRFAAQETARREQAEAERDALAREMRYEGALSKASRAVEQADPGTARRILETVIPAAGEPDLRGLEWRILWNQSEGDPAVIYRGLQASIYSISLSPDERTLLANTTDNHAALWDVATGKLRRVLSGVHRALGLSTDGTWLYGTVPDTQLARWNLTTGAVDVVRDGTVNRPLVMDGDHRLLSYELKSGDLRMWDFDEHRASAVWPLGQLTDATESPTFDYVDGPAFTLSSGVGSDIRAGSRFALCQFNSPKLWISKVAHDDNAVWLMSLSPDHRRVAETTESSNILQLADVPTGTVFWRVRPGPDLLRALAFSPDGRYIACGDTNNRVWIRDATDGASVAEFHGHAGGVTSAIWSRNPQALFTAAGDGTVRRWQAGALKTQSEYPNFWTQSGNPFICLTPTGDWFAATVDGERTAAVQVRGGNERRVFQARFPVGFTHSGTRLLGLTSDGALSEWSLDQPETPLWTRELFAKRTESLAGRLSPDGRYVLAGSIDEGTILWDLAEQKAVLTDPRRVSQISFSVNSKFVVALGPLAHAFCWSTNPAKLVSIFETSGGAQSSIAVSPDGQWIAIGTTISDTMIYSAPDYKQVAVLHDASGQEDSLLFSPDGLRLLVGGANGSVHFYRTGTWEEETVLPLGGTPNADARGGIDQLAMSADASTLAAYRSDGLIHIWDSQSPASQ